MKSAATDLESFLQSTLGPQVRVARCIVGGPAITLDARATAVLEPVLHEIVSDIAADGCPGWDCDVAICWSCDDQGRCVIELDNGSGGRQSRLEGGTARRQSVSSSAFERSGDGMVRCEMSERGARIIVPARYVATRSDVASRGVPAAAVPADPLTGRSVLVVEDQLIIALDLEMLLKEQGAVTVQLSGSVEDALRSITSERPDIAILDVNLGSATSFPVARELQRLGIPFIFATGYGNEVEFPPELRAVPLVAKPYCLNTIREALHSSCMAHA